MAASQTDKFKKVGAGTVTTLAAPGKALAASSINVGSTTNYPTDTGIVVAIRKVDTSGKLVAGTYTEWNATVTSATSLSISSTPRMGSDQVYPAGSTTQVFIVASAYAQNDLIDGLLVSHDQDGTLKSGAVDNVAVLADNVVETAKIKDLNVTTSKLADTSINATKLDFSTLLPSLFTAFGSSVQTYTNTGDGGGTGYYINLGGLKLCWGITGSITVSGASSKNISMPSSFFTNVRAAFHDKFGSAVFTTQQGAVPSTTTLQVYFGSGTGSAQVVWFVIGS